ncbi:MAG: hypothetical protein OEM04_11990, partial [Flavobacteriaceae bacterium]|nr:hypothetical protein [Flavobacteriaceae bacterium]
QKFYFWHLTNKTRLTSTPISTNRLVQALSILYLFSFLEFNDADHHHSNIKNQKDRIFIIPSQLLI